MAIGKPRGKNGMRPVFVYDPAQKRKVYVGSRKALRGPGGAQELEREKQAELSGGAPEKPGVLTVRAYSVTWLDLHHGDGTRRPAKTTHALNEGKLSTFLDAYGDRVLDGGIGRGEALKWAKKNGNRAKAVSAMFNDAVDDEVCTVNPFRNRRHEQGRGRKDIQPITEDEVTTLAGIALDMWGEDGHGRVVKATILFAAWVGSRPGETFGVALNDLDFDAGEVTIRRVKKRGGKHPVDVVAFPEAVQDAVRAIPDLPTAGPVFTAISGRPLNKGSWRYLWDPVRKAFERTLTAARLEELRAGRPDLDFYELRHFCGSVMADRGLTARDIAHQLGNSVKVCEETYVHVYRDRANDRVKAALNRSTVVDLDEARRRKGA